MNRHPFARGLRRLADDLLDVLYPRTCFACDSLLDDLAMLCGACAASVIPIGRRGCRHCGAEPLRQLLRRPTRCRRCRLRRFSFRRALAALRYSGAVQAGVVQLKFHGRREVVTWLARHLADALLESGLAARAQLVTAVPLHPLRRLARGFDQSALLAAATAAAIDRPFVPGVIRRCRHTRAQTLVSPAARRDNPRGAFAPAWRSKAVRGRRVLLIDDVMSTGATLHEAAQAILRAGAASVDAAVAAT